MSILQSFVVFLTIGVSSINVASSDETTEHYPTCRYTNRNNEHLNWLLFKHVKLSPLLTCLKIARTIQDDGSFLFSFKF